MLRRDAKVKRNVTSVVPASWQRLFAMYERLTKNIAKSQETMLRFMQYQEAVKMTAAQSSSAVHELALTIGVHEWTLGVIPQATGEVFLPKKMSIKCIQVTNILGYHRGDKPDPAFEETITLQPAQEHPIKPLIKSLKFEGQCPTAVIVVEHRNIKKHVPCLDEDQDKYILVMTAGYPSGAAREFLHMLAKDTRLARVPFLYFGDHDFQGIDIFKVLKTGSAKSAESNRSMVCSRLRWAGPRRKDLIDSPQNCLQAHRDQYNAAHPRASDKDVEADMRKWKAAKANTVQKKFQAANKTDRTLFKGFEKSGWLGAEPEMAAELKDMLEKNSKFRLADMAEFNPDYLSVFIDARVADLCKESQRFRPRALPAPVLTPERKQWLAAQSQSQGRSSSVETLRASASAPAHQRLASKETDEQSLSKEAIEALASVSLD